MRRVYTEDERQQYRAQQREVAQKRIAELVEKWAENPEDLAEYFRFAGKFHSYSPNNRALIYAQNPNATFVAPFGTFKEMGYYPHGQGMQIFRYQPTTYYRQTKISPWHPVTRNTPDDIRQQINTGMLETREEPGFRVGTVFDITQTDCPLSEYPKILGLGYDDAQHAAIYDATREYSAKLGMPVTEADHGLQRRGAYFPGDGHIEINQILGDTQKLSTLFHEMSHGIMSHGVDPSQSTAMVEFEADSLSIMLEDRYGIPITDARIRHLADHYRAYSDELTAEGKSITPDSFKRIYDQYEKHATDLGAFLNERGVLPTKSPIQLTAEPPILQTEPVEAPTPTQPTPAPIVRHIGVAQHNFNLLHDMAPEFMAQSIQTVRLEAFGFEPITMEWIGDRTLTITQTRLQDGAVMRNPSMELRVDNRAGIVQPLSYHHDGLGIHRDVGVGIEADLTLRRELNNTLNEWLKNISLRGYTPTIGQAQAQANVTEDVAPRLFVDMDGTLANFHQEANYLERMYEPHFFEQLAPYENTLNGLQDYLLDHPQGEVYLLSAAIDSPTCVPEKNAWADHHLPAIDAAHRIYVPAGENKADYIPGGIRPTDVLLDDYNRNLEQWRDAGGYPIKFVNDINDRGLHGELFVGDRLHYNASPSDISQQLEETLSAVKSNSLSVGKGKGLKV